MLNLVQATREKTTDELPPSDMEMDTPRSQIMVDTAHLLLTESELTYNAVFSQMAGAGGIEEELLVTNICTAVTMSLPQLPEERLQHAMYTKYMYLDGEITLQRFVMKMRNLFPNRMENLPEGLQAKLAKEISESN